MVELRGCNLWCFWYHRHQSTKGSKMRLIDLSGQRFGRLTVVDRAPSQGRVRWICRCDCGGEAIVSGDVLNRGASNSCGCLRLGQNRRHGLSGSSEHKIWSGIRERCTNPKSAFFSYYGGRGIYRCERWDLFESFYADMGPRPSRLHTIDRIDNDGPYSPENCRWALPLAQAANTRKNVYFEIGGERAHLSEWARRFDIDPDLVSQRILRDGMDPETALTRPKGRVY